MKELRHAVEKFQAEASLGEARQFLMSAKDVKGLKVAHRYHATAWMPTACARWVTSCGTRSPMWWLCWPPSTARRSRFLAVCGKEAVARGVKAGELVKTVCAVCGGKGGGKPDSAMGGGSDLLKLDDALASVDDFVTSKLG